MGTPASRSSRVTSLFGMKRSRTCQVCSRATLGLVAGSRVSAFRSAAGVWPATMGSKVASAWAYFCQPLWVAVTSRLEGSMAEQPARAVEKRAIVHARTTGATVPRAAWEGHPPAGVLTRRQPMTYDRETTGNRYTFVSGPSGLFHRPTNRPDRGRSYSA